MTSDSEKEREMTPENGGQDEVKQSGKTKKGKTAEGSEASRREKETPIVKGKRTPRGGAKINTSKRKKALKQEADESVELHDSLGKRKKAYEEEEMQRLKEELYQERRKKEDLVKECIRLERQNEKLIIKNNHLKRKQEGSSAQRGEYAPKRIAEGCRDYRQDNKGRGEQNEREDLKRTIENSRREFREREYLMQQSTMADRRGNNTQIIERQPGCNPN
ncbi:troponin T, fast skeletal muscle-like [Papaver somniferum]|uniref:troponin T, fast skeletal muscle-like n=1 Tax=Papaver somniferum TaxID=3469 RepID=UPI000E7036CE|nr:troponin T, fast skeletal muscle-like [Papaver somniferum]